MKNGSTTNALHAALTASKKQVKSEPVRELWAAYDGSQDLWIGFEKINGKYTYLESMVGAGYFVDDLFFDNASHKNYAAITIVKGDIKNHSGLMRAYMAAWSPEAKAAYAENQGT